MAAKKKPRTPRAKPRKVKRSAVDGRYGEGEKAAEKLARRIHAMVLNHFNAPTEEAVRHIKAELLAATTVTERQAEAIGAGWVPVFEGRAYSGCFDGTICVRETLAQAKSYYPPGASAVVLQYVRLVPATPPKARRAR